MVKRQNPPTNKKSIQTNLFVSSFDLIFYLFNKLYKIQVTQNTGYTKYTWFFIFTYHNCPLRVPLRRHLATA
jgi:hypothetical protein